MRCRFCGLLCRGPLVGIFIHPTCIDLEVLDFGFRLPLYAYGDEEQENENG